MAETETVLLRRFARTGDAEAFAEIIRRHAGLVYGAALRVLADMDRAADVAQDTFLQLTKDACCVTGSLPGWLHRVATHKAIDRMRRDASRRHRETEYAAGRSHRVAQWRDVSPYVDEGLNELDPEMRDILIAHFLEGRTTRHIAAVRGISQATVSRRIEAGVANLRGALRRRGIIVGTGALSLLLGEKAVQAAPATLMSELGKIALVGGHAAVVSTAATGVGSAGLQTMLGGLLASVQAKAIVAVSIAVVGVGSVVAYRHVTGPSSSPAPETVAAALAPPMRSAADYPTALSQAAASDAMAVPTDSRDEPNVFGQVPRTEGVRMAMGMCGGSVTPYTPPLKRDPNDSNDRSDEGPNGGAVGRGNPSMAGPPRADE